jgi:hypothetical protein
VEEEHRQHRALSACEDGMILILIFCDHLPTSANFVIEVPNPGTNVIPTTTTNIIPSYQLQLQISYQLKMLYQLKCLKDSLYRKRRKKTLRMLLAD